MNPCNRPEGHTGRCRSDDGTTWDGDHPTCERCQTLTGWLDDRTRERDRARADLTRLRAAVTALLAHAPDHTTALRAERDGQLTHDDALEAL